MAGRKAATAPPDSEGPTRPEEPSFRGGRAGARAGGRAPGQAAVSGGASDAHVQDGRGAAALGRASERAPGTGKNNNFLSELFTFIFMHPFEINVNS